MKLETISLDETGCFSSTFIDYIEGKDTLKPFYGARPQIQSFKDQIANKDFSTEKRQALNKVLVEQYQGIEVSEATEANIAGLLSNDTYTITTGHQLNICTGPLYFLYKIVTVINICKRLKKEYPKNNFVPVYWMASEDHDLEEINHFFLFGEKLEWQTTQTGAVGRMKNEEMEAIFEKLPEKGKFLENAYRSSECLADAVRCYVNELFGNEGLVIVDADSKELKALFSEVIKDDILSNQANEIVETTSGKLNELGFKTQVFPREINFFLLQEGKRDRIIKSKDGYKAKGTDQNFSEKELTELVGSEPEAFSPNVILRPLYQETILPNLAYIGGPAEVVYWLQLKGVFDHYQTPFPILMPRNFGLVIPKHILRKLNKVGLSSLDLFDNLENLKKNYLIKHSDQDMDLSQEVKQLSAVFETIKEKAVAFDKTLEGFVGAEQSKTLKGLDNIEKRIKKSEERNQEVAIQQIESVKNSLFPGGSLQERRDNFLNFYVNNPQLIEDLLNNFDPFNYSFHILKEEVTEIATAN